MFLFGLNFLFSFFLFNIIFRLIPVRYVRFIRDTLCQISYFYIRLILSVIRFLYIDLHLYLLLQNSNAKNLDVTNRNFQFNKIKLFRNKGLNAKYNLEADARFDSNSFSADSNCYFEDVFNQLIHTHTHTPLPTQLSAFYGNKDDLITIEIRESFPKWGFSAFPEELQLVLNK